MDKEAVGMEREAVTVWRDGRYKFWSAADAAYAQNDPDWLATIPLTQQPAAQAVGLDDIEQYRLQMAAISTAAIGYWKEGDSIHPDYDTQTLRDVAKLYAKYEALSRAAPSAEELAEAFIAGAAWRMCATNVSLRGVLEAAKEYAARSAPQPSAQQADPCPGCMPGGVCKTPECGRLKARQAEQAACTCGSGPAGGHSRMCAAFDESMLLTRFRYTERDGMVEDRSMGEWVLLDAVKALLAAPAAGLSQNEAVRRAWEGGQALRRAIDAAPAAAEAQPDRVEWDKFPAWLIDHHEGDTITEELLQRALADMLKSRADLAAQKEGEA